MHVYLAALGIAARISTDQGRQRSRCSYAKGDATGNVILAGDGIGVTDARFEDGAAAPLPEALGGAMDAKCFDV